MKTSSSFVSFIVFSLILFSPPLLPAAEEKVPVAKESPGVNPATPRETEILGTLEKPQFSTELAWQSPLIYNFTLSQPHRSFKKEIFRPVLPLLELNKKSESK